MSRFGLANWLRAVPIGTRQLHQPLMWQPVEQSSSTYVNSQDRCAAGRLLTEALFQEAKIVRKNDGHQCAACCTRHYAWPISGEELKRSEGPWQAVAARITRRSSSWNCARTTAFDPMMNARCALGLGG